jgi:hypothetical protein
MYSRSSGQSKGLEFYERVNFFIYGTVTCCPMTLIYGVGCVRGEGAEFEGCSLVLHLIILQQVSITIYFILCLL